jgi:hypothetical protein
VPTCRESERGQSCASSVQNILSELSQKIYNIAESIFGLLSNQASIVITVIFGCRGINEVKTKEPKSILGSC